MVQRQRVRSRARMLSKRRKHLPQGIATTLTVSIIAIIILAPSALAVSIEMHGLSNGQILGNSGSFTFLAEVTISSGEVVPLDRLNIVLDSVIFQFNPSTGDTIGSTSSVISSVVPVNFGASNLFTSGYGYAREYLKAHSYDYNYNYYGQYAYGYGFGGPRTFIWNVTLLPENLSTGDHTIRMDVVTSGLNMNTFSSSTVTFEVVAGISGSATIPTTSTTATVDHSSTTNTTVVLTGVTFIDSSVPATITTISFETAPDTSVTVSAAFGVTAVKFVDVKAFNLASGTATITITYTDAEVAGLDEDALTLYYWSNSAGTWIQFSNIVRTPASNTISCDIDVTLLGGTYIALGGTAPAAPPAAPPVVPPAVPGPGPGLPGVSATVNTNLRLVSLQVAPGSAITVSIKLSATQLMTSGSITLTLPENLVYSDLRTINFEGSSTLTGRTLVLTRSGASGSTTATIFFKLTAPLDSTVRVGETYTVSIDEITLAGMQVNFQTEQIVTFNIVQPTVRNIYSALDSHFNGISSPYTENRVPTITDIMNLLDFRLAGEVSP